MIALTSDNNAIISVFQLQGRQEIIFSYCSGIDVRPLDDLDFLALAINIHDVAAEFEVRKFVSQFVVSHLHMSSVEFQLFLRLVSWVELLEGATIIVINKDDLS